MDMPNINQDGLDVTQITGSKDRFTEIFGAAQKGSEADGAAGCEKEMTNDELTTNSEAFVTLRLPRAKAVQIVAAFCHEINRAYCRALGDDSQPTWADAPDWQHDSAVQGVIALLGNSGMSPEETHASWAAHKISEGWRYGAVKDPVKKEHPCLVAYDDLPVEQKAKDFIFKAVIQQFEELLGKDEELHP